MDCGEEGQFDLPHRANLFSYQIAGHKHGQGKTKLGMLKHENGNILKPLIHGDRRSVSELAFYENLFQNFHSDPILQEMKEFLPGFNGTWETSINGKNVKYLCLEDICENFQQPCVLDIKIGAITYDPEASEEKIHLEKEKYPPGKVLGFRILGMKVYDDHNKLYISRDRMFGRQQTPDTIISALELFMSSYHKQISCLILSGFIHKLLKIAAWFSKQRKFAFYSSSILFAYEGSISTWKEWIHCNDVHIEDLCSCMCDNVNVAKDNTVLGNQLCTGTGTNNSCCACGLCKKFCCKLQNNCCLYRVAMIDFAHVFPSSTEDSNYLFGLNNLIKILKELLKVFVVKSL